MCTKLPIRPIVRSQTGRALQGGSPMTPAGWARSLRATWLGVCAALCLSTAVHAQEQQEPDHQSVSQPEPEPEPQPQPSPPIRGLVHTPDGKGVISGALVTLTNTTLAAVTATDGSYVLDDVPPGTWELRIS